MPPRTATGMIIITRNLLQSTTNKVQRHQVQDNRWNVTNNPSLTFIIDICPPGPPAKAIVNK